MIRMMDKIKVSFMIESQQNEADIVKQRKLTDYTSTENYIQSKIKIQELLKKKEAGVKMKKQCVEIKTSALFNNPSIINATPKIKVTKELPLNDYADIELSNYRNLS